MIIFFLDHSFLSRQYTYLDIVLEHVTKTMTMADQQEAVSHAKRVSKANTKTKRLPLHVSNVMLEDLRI